MDLDKKIFYGSSGKDLQGKIITSDPFPEIEIGGIHPFSIKTKLAGIYNFSNVLAAVCIGRHFNVEDKKIKAAIENYTPSNSRSQLIQQNSNIVILDAYNANPGSMQAAIENFAAMKGNKKVLLLGSMMELGSDSEREHATLISLIDKYKWQNVVFVGNNFNSLDHKYIKYDTALEVKDWLHDQHLENAQILIKGSRSMQMEKVLE